MIRSRLLQPNSNSNSVLTGVSSNTEVSNAPSLRFNINTTASKNIVNYRYERPKSRCMEYDGKWVLVEPHRGVSLDHIKAAIIAATPLYTSDTFASAPDGTYCWVDTEKGFAAVQVRSPLEIGTLHAHIVDRIKARGVFVAGEVIKAGKTATYNIVSGTFSEKLPRIYDTLTYDEMVREARDLFKDMELEARYEGEDTFITAERLPITAAELQVYKDAGYDVILFPTKGRCLMYDPGSGIESEVAALQHGLLFQLEANVKKATASIKMLEDMRERLVSISKPEDIAEINKAVDKGIEEATKLVNDAQKTLEEARSTAPKNAPVLFGGRQRQQRHQRKTRGRQQRRKTRKH